MVSRDGLAFNIYEGGFNHTAVAWARPRRLLVTLDAIAIVIAFVAAYVLLPDRLDESPTVRWANLVFQIFICAILLLLLYRAGQYSSDRRMARFADLAVLLRNAVLSFFFVAGVWMITDGFFTGYRDQSRAVVFSGILIFTGLLTLNRLAMTWYQRRLFARGEGVRNVILVGQGRAAADFTTFLEERPRLGVRCAATMPTGGEMFSIERVRKMLESGQASDVVLALDPEERPDFDRISAALSQAGLSFRVVPALFEESLRAVRVNRLRGLSVFDVDVDPLDHAQRNIKRAVDVIVSALMLLVLSPLLLFAAVAIKLDSSGPVVFRQVRLGIGGHPFEMLKLRTMVSDAEARLAELRSQDEGDGPHFKLKKDPRITRVGGFLRKWSIDELLQFVNVLRGDMSLVGPRPPLSREVDGYETYQLVRLRGKPGITGLWQISGRKDLTFDDMVRLDRQYVENWSVGMDLSILVRTVGVVAARKGAY
jgi:exopolysaccharide biosynthesis polyprenyl glycosylphosphotransferase